MSLLCTVCNRKKPFPDVETFQRHMEGTTHKKRLAENLKKPKMMICPKAKECDINNCPIKNPHPYAGTVCKKGHIIFCPACVLVKEN